MTTELDRVHVRVQSAADRAPIRHCATAPCSLHRPLVCTDRRACEVLSTRSVVGGERGTRLTVVCCREQMRVKHRFS